MRGDAKRLHPGAKPKWSFVAFWPDFYGTNTSSIPALFKSNRVLKLSDMPGWK
jgi:hypothetical protein